MDEQNETVTNTVPIEALATQGGEVPAVGDIVEVQMQAEVVKVENGTATFIVRTVNGAEVAQSGGKVQTPAEADADEEARMRAEARHADENGLSGGF